MSPQEQNRKGQKESRVFKSLGFTVKIVIVVDVHVFFEIMSMYNIILYFLLYGLIGPGKLLGTQVSSLWSGEKAGREAASLAFM